MNKHKVKAYAAKSEKDQLSPFTIKRRDLDETDVLIEIEYCGICHTDIHFARNDLGITVYPIVPGHEIVGTVKSVGSKVSKFKEGQLVGVGCMVDSCGSCSSCKENLEQFCKNGLTMTYNSPDSKIGGVTFGGYSTQIVVDQDFVLSISEKLDRKSVAPLLCAGITTYSPLKRFNVKKGDRIGIIGLGGLGHMGVKFASAMGAKVVMITRSYKKGQDAIRLGADEVIISTNQEQMQKNLSTFDLILNTIPSEHNVSMYLQLLKSEKLMVVVGLANLKFHTRTLLFGRNKIVGSLIGGIKETQEMLDFCAEHNVVSDVEVIDAKEINKAYGRVERGDVKYRVVIDINSLR